MVERLLAYNPVGLLPDATKAAASAQSPTQVIGAHIRGIGTGPVTIVRLDVMLKIFVLSETYHEPPVFLFTLILRARY